MKKKKFIEKGQIRNERIILIIYSLYTLSMVFVSILQSWSEWVPIVITAGTVATWIMHVKRYKDHCFRAFAISSAVLMNFIIYGAFSENFFEILCMMSALVILLGIFGIPKIIHLAAGASLFLLFLHGVVRSTIHMASVYETVTVILQIGSVLIVECITYYLVKKHLEINKVLEDTIETLKKTEQSKDDFMANVSHEIRTPINTISGMSEMILWEEIPEEVREYVFDIQTAGRKLLSVVSDMLDFSELESGKMELVEEPYNLTSTINDIMNIAVAQKGSKPIEIIVDCDASIPSSLLGDEQKIRRVIMNLLNNAIKFTSEGCITIQFSARKEEYGINLCVKVKDTGIGMKEEDLEKLFTSFNQADTKKNRQEGGIGLGLAISQAIVSKMGGFITINSVYKQGTEIQFVIPQKVLEEEPIVSVKELQKICVVGYINLEKYHYAAIREGYSESIGHMVQQLGIQYCQCRNLAEFKRQIKKKKYSHVFISWEEYCEDIAYFEVLSCETKVILVLEKKNETVVGGNILRIYKPFCVLSVAAVLNGEEIVQGLDNSRYHKRRFVAPQANILVVDDNIMNLRVVEGLLRPYKINVFTAISGKEALTKIETMDYDFVFMDHMMPEMDGVETLHQIRQKPGSYFQTVPIIALTANAIGDVREVFLAEGFQDFVAKPIELSVLERVLRRYIPESKIIRIEEYEETTEEGGTESSQKESDFQNADIPVILEGIDVQQGIAYCGGVVGDYIEIIQVYYETGLHRVKEIETAYEKTDWKNYTILVHTVKSTSLGIGAGKLADMAKELEFAGKEENVAYIKEHHAEMMQEYSRVMNVIEAEIQTKEDGVKILSEIDKAELEKYLDQLASQLDTFESMEVEQLLCKLSAYQYHGKKVEELLKPVQIKVREFDFMGAGDELVKVREKMR